MKIISIVVLATVVSDASVVSVSIGMTFEEEIMRSSRDLIGWNRYRNSGSLLSRRKLQMSSKSRLDSKSLYTQQLLKFLKNNGHSDKIDQLYKLSRK